MTQNKKTAADTAFRQLQEIVYDERLNSAQKLRRVIELSGKYEGGVAAFVNAAQSDKFPLFFVPIACGEPLIVKYFLDNGADAKVTRASGTGKEKGVYGVVHELLRGAYRVKDPSHEQIKARLEIGKMLIDAGANPNLRDSNNRTPLMYALSEPPYGSIVRFKPNTSANLAKMLDYKSLADATANCDIKRPEEQEVTVDEESSAAHLWFRFFHQEAKEFDPKQTLGTRLKTQITYQQLLDQTVATQLRDYTDSLKSSDEWDKRNIGIRETALTDIIEHTSIATREDIVKKNPKAKWILPDAMQKSLGRG